MAEFKELWASETTASGCRLHAAISEGVISLKLLRATFTYPDRQQEYAVSELAVYHPTPLNEIVRAVAHWCDFYDPSLKDVLPGFAKRLKEGLQVVTTSPPPDVPKAPRGNVN